MQHISTYTCDYVGLNKVCRAFMIPKLPYWQPLLWDVWHIQKFNYVSEENVLNVKHYPSCLDPSWLDPSINAYWLNCRVKCSNIENNFHVHLSIYFLKNEPGDPTTLISNVTLCGLWHKNQVSLLTNACPGPTPMSGTPLCQVYPPVRYTGILSKYLWKMEHSG